VLSKPITRSTLFSGVTRTNMASAIAPAKISPLTETIEASAMSAMATGDQTPAALRRQISLLSTMATQAPPASGAIAQI